MTKTFIELVSILLNRADMEKWTEEKFMAVLNEIYGKRPDKGGKPE